MNNKSTKKVNGVTQLDEQMENMRLTVVDLEMKARYWKAQAEIREYTLKYNELQPAYEEYVKAQQELAEKLKAEQEKTIQELQERLAEQVETKIEA